ncbi:hypothetical protein B0A49_01943 [Cryomyces minteri]|uniref:PH domain-containing protein n=1 Tax=Cryomyces minteri TaxID=331657 RepID=A0A4U0XQQ9_9PEZI|nr:hypothetical protein B0A49_01720 [Cryomyces minteri]TKA78837.1 hypothetical protein B0A49_01943 [Cryomyces minteri]
MTLGSGRAHPKPTDADPFVGSHKRSKSGLARSLLQRVSSRQDVNRGDDEQSPISSPTAGPGSSAAFMSSPTSAPAESLERHTSGTKSNPSTTMMPSSSSNSLVAPPPSQPAAFPQSPISQGSSIEQSVKLFRLFEALRSGDTATISRAIRAPSAQTDTLDSDLPPASPSVSAGRLEGTSILHLAIQCAELPVIEYVLMTATSAPSATIDINTRDRDGNTPLHLASMLGRAPVVRMLLDQKGVNDSTPNYQGRTPLDLARNPEIFQQLQLARSMSMDTNIKEIHRLVAASDYDGLERLITESHTIDVNGGELATDPSTTESGGTLLHEAARKKDTKLIQLLLLNGADPFRRDRKGKLPQDVTKDDRTRAILKKSPAAAAAQRGVQEKTILGSNAVQTAAGPTAGDNALGGKEGREMKGYLKKWTNYTQGYKLRFFVLEDGVLSYYKHQDDAGSACRGAINMRIAKLAMDPQEKTRFDILGKSSVRYSLKANHEIEAKRWYWALNNAIQWSKDEARVEEKRQHRENEALKQAKSEQIEKLQGDTQSLNGSRLGSKLMPGTAFGVPLTSSSSRNGGGSTLVDDDGGAASAYEPSVADGEMGRILSRVNTATIEGDIDDDEDYGDDASEHETQPVGKDAFNLTAQSAKVQLDILGQVSAALQAERVRHPTMQVSDPIVASVLSSFDSAVGNLKVLVGDLLRISKDRDAYWQYRLDREANVRRLWEDSMAKVAREQEQLESRIGESEDKRRRTKRVLRDVLEGQMPSSIGPSRRGTIKAPEEVTAAIEHLKSDDEGKSLWPPRRDSVAFGGTKRRPTIADLTNNDISDSDSDDDEEFFDAIGAGEVEVVDVMPVLGPPIPVEETSLPTTHLRDDKMADLKKSFKGYEDPVRSRLKMDADDRPKISLWGILKSMIGKDMTKMTLPVSFNEPTSLLQRVTEDVEYTDLLETAAERTDPTERMVYVAAFAASEYASTIGRVAKPFNPLLGETYEYARPDKGYRFFIEQVSHHPPIGAAWAESANWEYYGESAVKSKFYGKSFDINPLGTWFLRLRPTGSPHKEELYTWKKVTSSVIGIITGNPTVDNYGPMEIKNWTTGEKCVLEFKPRGWKASSAYQVSGKVLDAQGNTRWSIGGRWNDKIYARLTPGYEGAVEPPTGRHGDGSPQAFLVWESHPRPIGIPFNLTPFGVTLNALPDRLRPILAPTDTRLRPDQRAMEDGQYDFAATEKNRVEEKQRAKRRQREAAGEEFVPRWFTKERDKVTGEEFWKFTGEYWKVRNGVAEEKGTWAGCEDIF